MKNIAIDIGTYSIKCLEFAKESGNSKVVKQWEYKLSDYPEETLFGKYELIFDELFGELPTKSKVLVTLPSEMGINRFLFLPIKNKKKAEQMVPFQIEEDIPYVLSEAHLGVASYTKDKGQMAHIGVVPRKTFEDYLEHIFSKWQGSLTISLDTAAYQTGLKNRLPLGPVCILDFGHYTTKAHFFMFGKLVSTHKSYVGGKNITEAIAKTYNISLADAERFKHDHCFVLPNELIAESGVDSKQQAFAQLINTTLSPLIQDIKRWILGFKMKYAQELESVYLTGGSSQIQNLTNYLSHLTHVRTILLSDSMINEISGNYHLAYSISLASHRRSELMNLISGDYKRSMADEISIESLAFIGGRVGIVSALLLFAVLLEQVSLRMELKKLDANINKSLKNPIYQISAKDLRQYQKKPDTVYNQLKNQKRTISQEIKTIQSVANMNALSPLVKLSKFLNKQDINIISYDVDGDIKTANIKISILSNAGIDKIEKDIRDMGLVDLKINTQEAERIIEASFAFE